MKWLHTLGSVSLVLLSAFTPVISTFISAHPQVAGILAGAYAILGQFAPHKDPAPPAGTAPGTSSGPL